MTDENEESQSASADQPIEERPWNHGLTDKQQRLIEEYCKDFNRAGAARRAGYSEDSAKQIAYETFTKPYFRNAINAYLDERSMTTSEAIDNLTIWGRGSLEPFFNEAGEIDIQSDQAKANYKLLKEFDQTVTTTTSENSTTKTVRTRIRIADPLAATVKILEVRGKIVRAVDVTTKGKELQSGVILYLPDNGRQGEQS